MQPKAIISLFLAIILACTILPIRQVGSLLAGNQLQEELPHSSDSGKTSFGKADGKTVFFYHDFADHSSSLLNAGINYFPVTEALPDYFVGEIQTPPPNHA